MTRTQQLKFLFSIHYLAMITDRVQVKLTRLPSISIIMSPRIIRPPNPRVVGSNPALAARLFTGT